MQIRWMRFAFAKESVRPPEAAPRCPLASIPAILGEEEEKEAVTAHPLIKSYHFATRVKSLSFSARPNARFGVNQPQRRKPHPNLSLFRGVMRHEVSSLFRPDVGRYLICPGLDQLRRKSEYGFNLPIDTASAHVLSIERYGPGCGSGNGDQQPGGN